MIVKAKNQAVNKNIYNVVGLKTMKSLGLIKPLVQLCETLHITTPTIIQQKCIPRILQGENLVGIAETGTGKTACYCLPTLQLLTKECYGIFGLILLPTKELAFQVFEQFRVFSTLFGWESEIAWIVGGDKWLMQSQTLARRPFIVVATPGRLLQHLENTDVRASFKNLRILVFDEADSLLDNTLQSEVQQILKYLPNSCQRQTLLFSATWSSNLTNFVETFNQQTIGKQTNKGMIRLDTVPSNTTVLPNLEHYYIFIPSHIKLVYLLHILFTTLKDQPGIIFTKTCQSAQILTTILELYKLPVTTLHGLLDHKRRCAHLAKFRGAISTILVATEIAARGLDIPKVNFVLNFDFSKTLASYIHRAGRTARVGRQGICMSLICEKDDTSLVKTIESYLSQTLEEFPVEETLVLQRLSEVTKKNQEARQILTESGFFERAIDCRRKKLKKLGLRPGKLAFKKKCLKLFN